MRRIIHSEGQFGNFLSTARPRGVPNFGINIVVLVFNIVVVFNTTLVFLPKWGESLCRENGRFGVLFVFARRVGRAPLAVLGARPWTAAVQSRTWGHPLSAALSPGAPWCETSEVVVERLGHLEERQRRSAGEWVKQQMLRR